MIFLILAAVLAQANLPVHGAVSCCPTYWTSYNNNCYRIYGEHSLTWQKAEDYCKSEGRKFGKSAHLVSLLNQAESDFVKDLWVTATCYRVNASSRRNMYWIGLTDRYYEGQFRWSDSSHYYYSNFHPGEPNNNKNQDCAVVWDYQYKDRGLWDDESCDKNYPFICKFNL